MLTRYVLSAPNCGYWSGWFGRMCTWAPAVMIVWVRLGSSGVLTPSLLHIHVRHLTTALQSKYKKYRELVETIGEVFIPLVFFTSGAHSVDVSILLKHIRDTGDKYGASDPIGHQQHAGDA